MTARDILNNGVKLDDKFVDDTINAVAAAATDRINGNSNNEDYKKRMEEIRKNVEAKKQQEKRIALIKASQEVKLFPYVFSQEISKKVEARILEKSKQEVKALTEDDYINMTLSKAALWAKRNNVLNNKLRRFLLDNTCILKALRGEYYKPIFLFCSDFYDRCNDITEEDLLKKNSIRAFHPQLYEALKEVLREKFVD